MTLNYADAGEARVDTNLEIFRYSTKYYVKPSLCFGCIVL